MTLMEQLAFLLKIDFDFNRIYPESSLICHVIRTFQCSATCGRGTRNRTVTCITSGEACSLAVKPESQKACEVASCGATSSDVGHYAPWLYSEWSSKVMKASNRFYEKAKGNKRRIKEDLPILDGYEFLHTFSRFISPSNSISNSIPRFRYVNSSVSCVIADERTISFVACRRDAVLICFYDAKYFASDHWNCITRM